MKKIILILLIIPLMSFAKDVKWDGSTNILEIGDKVEILEDPSGLLSYSEVISPIYDDQFKSSESLILALGYTDSFFWVRFIIDNQTSSNVVLEFAQAGLPVTELYYKNDTSAVQFIKSGYQVGIANKKVRSSYQVFSLPPGKSICYVHLNSNSEPIPINLHTEKFFEQASSNQKIGYGIYLGLMLFVVLNNIFIFISLRKKLYLFYGLIVIMYIAYSAAVIDGFIVYFIPQVNLKFLYTTIPSLGVILQTTYCLVFLESKKYAPTIHKVVKFIIVYFSIWFAIKFFLPFKIVQPVNTLHALISFFTMAYVGIRVGFYGNKMGYYFAIAYLFYFILVGIQALYINTGSPAYIGGLSFVGYATLIESFLLSYLLSRRYEWEKRVIENEKFEAQQKVIQKTEENKRIVVGQKAILAKQVKARTAQLREINEELLTSNESLFDLNREKDGLINVVAHDLRSPLSTIVNFTELLFKQGNLTQSQGEYLSIIDSSAQNGIHLIGDLIDVHSFDYAESTLTIEEIDIRDYITDCIKNFDQDLHKKQQQLKLNIQINNNTFKTDHFLLSRILNNLISNAIKFSEKGKHIHLTVLETGDSISFKIKDEGPGITEEDQKLMFKLFQKLSARPTNGESSNGLGLSIIKKLTDKLHGQIKVNTKIGEGTEFIIELPKK